MTTSPSQITKHQQEPAKQNCLSDFHTMHFVIKHLAFYLFSYSLSPLYYYMLLSFFAVHSLLLHIIQFLTILFSNALHARYTTRKYIYFLLVCCDFFFILLYFFVPEPNTRSLKFGVCIVVIIQCSENTIEVKTTKWAKTQKKL